VGYVLLWGVRLARRHDLLAITLVPLIAYLTQGLIDVNDLGID